MMLATSEKRWEPSYNADLAVTRHGVIVSQFLTKRPTDYHSFGPALAAVLESVGRPDSWVGDTHYGTQANLLVAHHAGVTLYAPPIGGHSEGDESPSPAEAADEALTPISPNPAGRKRFSRADFLHDAERDVMICPAHQELPAIGTYPTENGLRSYRVYGRTDCGACLEKDRCTDGRARRVKVVVDQPPPSGLQGLPSLPHPAGGEHALSPDEPISVTILRRAIATRIWRKWASACSPFVARRSSRSMPSSSSMAFAGSTSAVSRGALPC